MCLSHNNITEKESAKAFLKVIHYFSYRRNIGNYSFGKIPASFAFLKLHNLDASLHFGKYALHWLKNCIITSI